MRALLAAVLLLTAAAPVSAQWQRLDLGVTNLYSVAFVASDADYLYAAVLTGQPVPSQIAIARSGDDGTSWQTVFSGVPGARFAAFAHLDGQMVALLTGGGQAGLLTSTDQGITWRLSSGRIPITQSAGVARMGATYIVVGANPSYRSADGGATWTPFGQDQPMVGAVSFGGAFYGLSGIGQVFRLDADAWTQVNVGVPFVSDLWAEGGALWAKASAGALFSSPNGAAWSAQPTAAPGTWSRVIYDPGDGRPWFLHSAAAAIDLLLSDDQGTTATSIADGYPRDDNGGICVSGYAISRAAVIGNAVCSFTEPDRNGVFRYVYGTITTTSGTPQTEGLSLAVDGNPTRGGARLIVRQGTPGVLDVALFDVLGRRVAHLVHGEARSRETTATLPDGLAPGTYVIRAVAHGQVVSRTLTVVR